ncbi:MAG: phosphatase PAP2 family protein [Thermodesulfobacteriota bacterium]
MITIMWQWIENIDIGLFYLINASGQNAFFDVIMPFISNEKNFYVPLAIAWLLLVIAGSRGLQLVVLKLENHYVPFLTGPLRRFAFTRSKIKLRTVAVAVLILISFSEWISSGVLKPVFDRPRPYHSLSRVHLYDRMFKTWSVTPELKTIVRGESLSLPSSHATNIFAAAFFLSFFFRKVWPLFYLIAFWVGYSRVYLGVHFPFDVFIGGIAGTLCGAVMAWVGTRVIRFDRRRLNKNDALNT